MVAYAIPSTMRAQRLADYNYVRVLTRSRVAWEYLRRNFEYQSDWRISAPGRPRPLDLTDDTVLLRAQGRFLRAEAWGLCTFRRSLS